MVLGRRERTEGSCACRHGERLSLYANDVCILCCIAFYGVFMACQDWRAGVIWV